jgi:putative membrane protein
MIYLFNFDCNSFFGFERNHYDRLVHFSFGVLLLASSRDLIMRLSKFNTKQALLVALLSIQAFSMLYELFEWGIAISLSEGAADSYNGQQGDMWDAHKDMALAMIGSVLAFLFLKSNKTI